MGFLDAIKHAFAVDPPGPAEPTERQREVTEKLCREIVRRHMTTPALLALEMSRPLNYLGSQALVFLGPFISAVTDSDGHRHLADFLEQRGSVEYLCRRLEALEAETNHERHETHERKENP